MASFPMYMSKHFIPCQLAIKCLFFMSFTCTIFIHQEGTGDELGLLPKVVFGSLAGNRHGG